MLKKQILIKAKSGIHARPASILVRVANSFRCKIFLEKELFRGDCKSLLDILELSILNGETVTVMTDGDDEDEALKKIVNVFENDIGED